MSKGKTVADTTVSKTENLHSVVNYIEKAQLYILHFKYHQQFYRIVTAENDVNLHTVINYV